MLEITLEVRELDRAFTSAVGVSNEDIDPDPETVIP